MTNVTIRNKVLVLSMIIVTVVPVYSQTHVFWYKASTNGYAISAVPGPGVPSGAIVHEGMAATAANAEGLGYPCDGFNLGSAMDDDQGWNSFFWSSDLNDDATMMNAIDSAYLSGELRDGFASDMFNQAGPIVLKVGLVDVSLGITMWGGPSNIPKSAVWSDLVLTYPLAYNLTCIPGTETTVNVTGLAGGRTSESASSTLDSTFFKIDVTSQVNYILSNTGQYAIVFLAPMGQGSVGKINAYAFETCVLPAFPQSSDHPWTTDGNTIHLVAYGTPDKTEAAAINAHPGMSLAQNMPNPFNPSTSIAYNTGGGKGIISILNATGALVYSSTVAGKGALTWNASTNSSGIYVCRIQVGDQIKSMKMIFMK